MFYLTIVVKPPTGVSTYMGGGSYKQLHIFNNIGEFKEFAEKVEESNVVSILDWYTDELENEVVYHEKEKKWEIKGKGNDL